MSTGSIRLKRFESKLLLCIIGVSFILTGTFIFSSFFLPNSNPRVSAISSGFSVNIDKSDPTIAITPVGTITTNFAPSPMGTFNNTSASVAVDTSNPTGYTFTMNTETTSADLKNSQVDYSDPTKADYKITPIANSTTGNNFNANTWGYNVNKSGTYLKGAANTYLPVPSTSATTEAKQIEITESAGYHTYNFNFGVKANLGLPAGEYSTTLIFSATANELPGTPYTITYVNDYPSYAITPMPESESGYSETGTITISSIKPSKDANAPQHRSDIWFLGWADDSVYEAHAGSNLSETFANIYCGEGTSILYQADDVYTLEPSSQNNITMHAIYNTSDSGVCAPQIPIPTPEPF